MKIDIISLTMWILGIGMVCGLSLVFMMNSHDKQERNIACQDIGYERYDGGYCVNNTSAILVYMHCKIKPPYITIVECKALKVSQDGGNNNESKQRKIESDNSKTPEG